MIKTVTIHVTDDDINNGTHYSPSSCPVAIALRREFGKYAYVSVNDDISVNDEAGDYTCEMYPDVLDFITRFDRGDDVGPVEFTLTFSRE